MINDHKDIIFGLCLTSVSFCEVLQTNGLAAAGKKSNCHLLPSSVCVCDNILLNYVAAQTSYQLYLNQTFELKLLKV